MVMQKEECRVLRPSEPSKPMRQDQKMCKRDLDSSLHLQQMSEHWGNILWIFTGVWYRCFLMLSTNQGFLRKQQDSLHLLICKIDPQVPFPFGIVMRSEIWRRGNRQTRHCMTQRRLIQAKKINRGERSSEGIR